jgi:hypothetical protein
MVSTNPVRRDPDDGPDGVLERALRLEIAGYWPWKSVVWGVVLHAVFGLCLYVAVYRGAGQSEPPAARQVLAQIFVPPSSDSPSEGVRHRSGRSLGFLFCGAFLSV